jgi:2-polyprenyl-6-methoxyphenol hydroxylase-like FAD-dependent oxidoreductase
MTTLDEHAVVLGAGISGLCAASVLADHFRHVTIVERDSIQRINAPRRGIPQGHHPHSILMKTEDLLDELFPGLQAECLQAGGVRVGLIDQLRVAFYGRQLHQTHIGRNAMWSSRAFLEHHIRERVMARRNIDLRQGWEAVSPIAPTSARIRGVTISSSGANGDPTRTEHLTADLVVDATGRASRSQTWLRELGYPNVPEQRTAVRLSYATQALHGDTSILNGDRMIAIGPQSDRPQGLVMVPQEHNRWLLTVYGYGDQRPDNDPDRFMSIVRDLAPADMWAAVLKAEPIGTIAVHQVPSTYRRRYDKLKSFPEGLLIVGDALSNINPIYGTGMLHAADQALILNRRLQQGRHRIHRGFFRDANRTVTPIWWLSTISDATLPGVSGPTVPGANLAMRYIRRLLTVAERNPALATQFMQVIGSLNPPTSLLRPTTLLRVLNPLGRRCAPGPSRPGG